MGIGFNGTPSADVTVSGDINVTTTKGTGMTIVHGQISNSAGTSDLYTVPANKIARVLYMQGSCLSNTGTATAENRILLNAVNAFTLTAGIPTAYSVDSAAVSFGIENAPVLTAGQKIQQQCTHTQSWFSCSVGYVEYDA